MQFIFQCMLLVQLVCTLAVAQYPQPGSAAPQKSQPQKQQTKQQQPMKQQQQQKQAPKQQGYGQAKGNSPSSSPSSSSPPPAQQQQQNTSNSTSPPSPSSQEQQQQPGYQGGPAGNDLPHVVGMDVEDAMNAIKKYSPQLEVSKFKPGDYCTAGVRQDRVRVWYDPVTNKVLSQPRRG